MLNGKRRKWSKRSVCPQEAIASGSDEVGDKGIWKEGGKVERYIRLWVWAEF